jgi:hypothetical protein
LLPETSVETVVSDSSLVEDVDSGGVVFRGDKVREIGIVV